MTPQDEIAKLARAYVADVYGGDTDFIDEAENVISWLLRTHCIVSKEKVRSVYEGLADTMTYAEKDSELQLRVVAASKRILLEALFNAETFKNSEV